MACNHGAAKEVADLEKRVERLEEIVLRMRNEVQRDAQNQEPWGINEAKQPQREFPMTDPRNQDWD